MMKLLPFTEDNRQQLIQQGYTHVCLLRSIEAEEREYNNTRDYFLYEAVKITVENLPNNCSLLTGDEVSSLITNDNIDCYIMLKK